MFHIDVAGSSSRLTCVGELAGAAIVGEDFGWQDLFDGNLFEYVT